MPSASHDAQLMLLRVRAGGPVLAADAAQLAVAIDRAIAGEPLEAALGLCGDWRAAVRSKIAGEMWAQSTRGGSASQEARIRHAELEVYAATHFAADLASRVKPTGERGLLYDLLVAHGGSVPSERTLRRELANRGGSVGQRSARAVGISSGAVSLRRPQPAEGDR